MSRDRQHRRGASRPSTPAGMAGMQTGENSALARPRPALMAAVCAFLVIAVFAAFGGLLDSGFVQYDDPGYVTENTHVQKGLTGGSIAWAFTTTEATNWHPLTWLSHMMDVQLFGMNPGGHHLTSLLLHILNAILLFLLLFRMTGALWRSAFVAALFALHPLHVESVAWIAERKDVLSTLFWLLTTGAWLAYVKSSKAVPYALMLAFFALGLMSKPMLVTLPFTLLLFDYWPLQRLTLPLRGRWGGIKGLLWEKAPLFAMAAASCAITFTVQRGGKAVKTMVEFPFDQRVANAAQAYVSYLGKTIWPSSLAVLYPHPHTGLFTPFAILAFLALAGVTALAFRLRSRAPCLLFGWLWYLGTLVPVIGLIQVGGQAMADRYTYIPLVGIFIAVAWGLAEIPEQRLALRRAVAGAAIAAMAALFALTRIQTGYWTDNETLFAHDLAVTSENALAHYQIGCIQFNKDRVEEAIAHFRESLRINPRYAEAHTNLGIALDRMNRTPEAVDHFREALRILPRNMQAMNNLGSALVKLHRLPEALDRFEEAVRLDPDNADARNNLGNVLAASGRLGEAVEHYRQALRIQPDSVKTLCSMGLALGKMKRLSEAIQCFRDAVRINPNVLDAQNNLGVALVEAGRPAEALEHYRQALRIQPDSVKVLDNLGLALGRTNRLPEAIECFQQAVRLNPDFADTRYHLGISLVEAHRLTEAQEQFEQALRINPGFAQARAGLREVQQALGQAP